MRRWTVLLIPHDSEALKSISVTDRALRLAGAGGVVLLLLLLVGVGSMIAQVGRVAAPPTTGRTPTPAAQSTPDELVALRNRVGALRRVLDTIGAENARLQDVAGLTGTDTATLFRRFLGKLPRLLRPGPKGPAVVQLGPVDSQTLLHNTTSALTAADSLLLHANGMANRYRNMGPVAPR